MAKVTPGFNDASPCGSDLSFSLGGHHCFVEVELAFISLRIRPDLRKKAGLMVVEVGREMFLIEGIDERGPALGNVAMVKEFPDHRPILSFHQGVIIGLTSAGFGEVDKQLPRRAATRSCIPSHCQGESSES